MADEVKLREQICLLAKSIFDRGLTGGSTGNLSSRTSDGGLLVSPTGTSFGRLDPDGLAGLILKVIFLVVTTQQKRWIYTVHSMTQEALQELWCIYIHVILWRYQ